MPLLAVKILFLAALMFTHMCNAFASGNIQLTKNSLQLQMNPMEISVQIQNGDSEKTENISRVLVDIGCIVELNFWNMGAARWQPKSIPLKKIRTANFYYSAEEKILTIDTPAVQINAPLSQEIKNAKCSLALIIDHSTAQTRSRNITSMELPINSPTSTSDIRTKLNHIVFTKGIAEGLQAYSVPENLDIEFQDLVYDSKRSITATTVQLMIPPSENCVLNALGSADQLEYCTYDHRQKVKALLATNKSCRVQKFQIAASCYEAIPSEVLATTSSIEKRIILQACTETQISCN